MKIRIIIYILLSIGLVNTQANTVAIVGGTVIDGNGGKPLRNAIVLIEGNRITAVGEQGTVEVPSNATYLHVEGKYLIPGMMDANVHLFLESRPENLVRYENRFEDLISEAAQIALKNGVTTVFDSWGPRQPLINVREKINAGKITGSRIYLAGNIIGLNGPLSSDFSSSGIGILSKDFIDRINALWVQGVGRNLAWMTPNQLRGEIRKYLSKGIDFVKYAASGHSEMDLISFSLKAQKVIVEESHRAGVTAQAHTTSVESFRLAIEAGADILQHCEITGPVPIPASSIKLMVEKEVYCAALPYTEKRLAFESGLAEMAPVADRLPIMETNIRNMLEAGVRFLLATDGGVISQYTKKESEFFSGEDRLSELGVGHYVWLQAMAEKGMKPMDILLAATSNVAKAYSIDNELGSIEPGKIADILILDANPLVDVHNYRLINKVIKNGNEVDRQALLIKAVLTGIH